MGLLFQLFKMRSVFLLASLFFLPCLELKAEGNIPVPISYRSGSNNHVITPKARDAATVSGEKICGNSTTMEMYIYTTAYPGGSGVKAVLLTMPCDKDNSINLKEYVQRYLDEAIVATGGNNEIIIPEGTFPAGAILQSLCIGSNSNQAFGCSQALNASDSGGDTSPSCSVTTNLNFSHDVNASQLSGDKKTLSLPVKCTGGKVDVKITAGESSGNQSGDITIGNNSGITSQISVNGSALSSSGISVTLAEGSNNLNVSSTLMGDGGSIKGGSYTGEGILIINSQ